MTTSFSTVTKPREPFIERCPHCVGPAYLRPIHVTIEPDDGARCIYRCPACLYSWWTSWGTRGEDPKFLWTGRR
jgi:hypothetical protein